MGEEITETGEKTSGGMETVGMGAFAVVSFIELGMKERDVWKRCVSGDQWNIRRTGSSLTGQNRKKVEIGTTSSMIYYSQLIQLQVHRLLTVFLLSET